MRSCSLDVRVVQALKLLLLDSGPRQEEGGVRMELGETDVDGVAGDRVKRQEPRGVADDHEPGMLALNSFVSADGVDRGMEVGAVGLVTIEDPALPEGLARDSRAVVGPGPQAGDPGFWEAIGEQERVDELGPPGHVQLRDTILDLLQVHSTRTLLWEPVATIAGAEPGQQCSTWT